MKEDTKECVNIEGNFQICFVKLYGNEEKVFCLENVKHIRINSKKREVYNVPENP